MNVKKIVQDKWTKQKGKNEIKKKHTNKQTNKKFIYAYNEALREHYELCCYKRKK